MPLLLYAAPPISYSAVTIAASIGAIIGMIFHQKDKRKNTGNFFEGHTSNNRSFYPTLPPDPDDKKRKINTMTKTEFFQRKEIKQDYEHYRDSCYRRKNHAKGLDNDVEYLQWDHDHNDVEAYNKHKIHVGSYNPVSLERYKPPAWNRKLKFK